MGYSPNLPSPCRPEVHEVPISTSLKIAEWTGWGWTYCASHFSQIDLFLLSFFASKLPNFEQLTEFFTDVARIIWGSVSLWASNLILIFYARSVHRSLSRGRKLGPHFLEKLLWLLLCFFLAPSSSALPVNLAMSFNFLKFLAAPCSRSTQGQAVRKYECPVGLLDGKFCWREWWT